MTIKYFFKLNYVITLKFGENIEATIANTISPMEREAGIYDIEMSIIENMKRVL